MSPANFFLFPFSVPVSNRGNKNNVEIYHPRRRYEILTLPRSFPIPLPFNFQSTNNKNYNDKNIKIITNKNYYTFLDIIIISWNTNSFSKKKKKRIFEDLLRISLSSNFWYFFWINLYYSLCTIIPSFARDRKQSGMVEERKGGCFHELVPGRNIQLTSVFHKLSSLEMSRFRNLCEPRVIETRPMTNHSKTLLVFLLAWFSSNDDWR